MSSPPERSWMLATLIGSSAQALDPNMPAAAVAAVPSKNLLRLTFIAVFLAAAGQPGSDFDDVLLVVAGILDEIAHGCGIRRLLLREIFQHLELLVIYFRNVNIEHAMMGRRIDRDLAGGSIDADTGFQRLDDLHSIDGACFLDSLRPYAEALVGSHGQFGNIRIIGAEALVESRDKSFVGLVL